MNKTGVEEKLIEELADCEHESWANWMSYLFSKCTNAQNGDTVIPFELSQRWVRQMHTYYFALSEQEKESDRAEVRKILPIIQKYVSQAVATAVKKERENKITYHQIMGANDWLRNVYGLSDGDTLDAGEIEELLKTFINDSLSVPTTVQDTGEDSKK